MLQNYVYQLKKQYMHRAGQGLRVPGGKLPDFKTV
jgi:hypothetical protein